MLIDDEKIIQKKQRQAEKCLAKIEKLGTEIKKYMEDVSLFSAKEAIKIERVRPALYELNKDVTNLVCDEEALFLTSKEAEEYTGEVAFSIKGFFEKDRFCIKTPSLPSIYSQGKRKVFSSLYADEVKLLLQSNKKKLSNFSQANISIISIRASDSCGIDNDNIDSKAIVDAIAYYLKAGDSPRSCSFYLASIFDDTLEEGTYFIVTGDYKKAPGLSEIESWIKTLEKENMSKRT